MYSVFIIMIFILYYYFTRSNEGFTNGSENGCKFVSSRGILFSCNKYPRNPVSSIQAVSDIDLSSIQNGDTVYIQGSAIKDFAKKLDSIPNRFILVSGDCDQSIPDDIFTRTEFIKFIESYKIIHWFSQNCTGKHDKLSPIPIGLDYHTRSSSDRWGVIMSPKDQEAEILSLVSTAKPFHERMIKAYANFHFSMNGQYTGDRVDAKNNLPENSVWYEPIYTKTRLETFQRQINYAFVISPHGNGIDCHRTWEALVLGCIPIVKTSPIDSLYDNLPVLIIKDWSDVTESLLTDTIQEYKYRDFNYNKLNLKYWVDIIKSSDL